ncbi:alpha/beta fold hydrolase [Phenylobacterium sp.]|uniref:alpha/beta fold hydrolase n=1 Tax=Phenylobacterium sp. TaxID=1871053 RepID=UPI002731EC06|nr:alpha/beta fold hydrolase [Phenylobacterium sp.]MDP2213467.1 alpha/beta fold hydrolase [Phenylobacterium sp.]
MLKLLVLSLGALAVLWISTGLILGAAFAPKTLRGEMVDLGDRRLRLVCEGPASGPLVWLEAGAFGFSADFADLQSALAAEGVRSCAYDRAGLGFSDPGPRPRDSAAVVTDLERLMAAAGVDQPVVLLGHSMGGQHVRLFATRHPERVAGIVLVDAATPEAVEIPVVRRFVSTFGHISQATAGAMTLGLAKPLFFFGDRIGLSGPAVREKQAAFVSGRHARNAANEASHWLESAAMARAAGGLDPAWPVAVVTAGAAADRNGEWGRARLAPVEASQHGSYAAVPAAGHATILSHAHNAEIVAAVKRVIASAGLAAARRGES